MRTGSRARWALALALAVALGTSTAKPRVAVAWTNGPCPTSSGVTVIVDFGAFGAGVATRCAPDPPNSGLDALGQTGFEVTMVQSMFGFVCRIDGQPASDPCTTTPPAAAYWSYWTAPRGGSWTYSPVGAAGAQPADGTVAGWAFVQGSGAAVPPSVAPPGYAATPRPTVAPTPLPTPRPTPRSAPATPTPAGAIATPTPAATTPAASASPSDGSSEPSASAKATRTPSASNREPSTARGSPSPEPQPALPAPPGDVGGTPAGVLLGLGLVAAIGVAAYAARRVPAHAGD